ncbi:MAG: hypothetical protein HXX08_03545 [Chloroflexi bacterium]|uniref:Uncharacterized protein n=1 Tax=Candidatus Chlorohelix allophototropha TaxID=3003348 RepID=A0A8T7M0K7_9CHLR|nr:hypothetical protein [Chloroflexota bacterium]WJW66813.1 hypothetical protein OZ401_000058 [Chloroflexota bacterium L227-S17]
MDWSSLGTGIAVVLTLMIYSYLVGDNVLFRIAEYLLVGVSIGWSTLQIIFGIIIPAFDSVRQETAGGSPTLATVLTFAIPLVLGALLLVRVGRATRSLHNLIMALVIGTVSALALAGAVFGTLVPQVGQTIVNLRGGAGSNSWDILGNIVLVAGVLLSLAYFQFTIRKNPEESGTAQAGVIVRLLGRWSLMLAFGAIFGSVFLTYFAALIDRLMFLIKLGG